MKITQVSLAIIPLTIIASLLCSCQKNDDLNSADVVIYGGTSAGISAAIQTARLGKSVILIEPTNRLGGLTTGGLGQTDIGNKQVIGGISREFYQNIRKYSVTSCYCAINTYFTGQNRAVICQRILK